METADGILLGSPTYFSGVSTEMKALIDRSGFVAMANGCAFAGKIGAAVVAVRRGGATHAFDSMNHLFLISGMIVVGATYWNLGIGRNYGEVLEDKVRETSPAGIKAADSKAWYQQVSTYTGEQDTFHRRHLLTPMAKELMNLSCNTCHQGHDLPETNTASFRLQLPNRCGNCHPKLSSRYAMSIHGELTELGFSPAGFVWHYRRSNTRDYLRQQEVNLIVTDINMPEMNGITFLKELNKSFPKSLLTHGQNPSSINLMIPKRGKFV